NEGRRNGSPFTVRLLPSALCPLSPDHIGQQSEKARALYRARELALLLGRDRGDAAGHDLAALGDVALQQPHVLVIDLRGIGAGERTGLAAAEERPAHLGLGKGHRPYSVPPPEVSLSSRGGRASRSRRYSPRSRSRSRKPPRSRSRKPKPRSSRSR